MKKVLLFLLLFSIINIIEAQNNNNTLKTGSFYEIKFEGDYPPRTNFSHIDSFPGIERSLSDLLVRFFKYNPNECLLLTNKPERLTRRVSVRTNIPMSHKILLAQLEFSLNFITLDTIMEKEVINMKKIGLPKVKTILPHEYIGGGIGHFIRGDDLRCSECQLDQIQRAIENEICYPTLIEGFPDKPIYDDFSIPITIFKDVTLMNSWFKENLGIEIIKARRAINVKYIKFL